MSDSRPADDSRAVAKLISDVTHAARSGDYKRAYGLARAAVAQGARDAVLFDALAGWLARHPFESESAEAIEALQMAAAGNPALLLALGLLLQRLRRPQAALAAFDAAIDLRPEFARAHYERGVALGILGQIADMRAAHERAIALEPANADAHASLAMIAARTGDVARARGHAALSLSYRPNNGPAEAALAVADVHDGKFVEAQNRFHALLRNASLADDTRIDIAVSDAGDAFAQHGSYSHAFAAYAAVGERRRHRQLAAMRDQRAIDAVRRRTAYFKRSAPWPVHIAEPQPCPARGHVFVLGFMRSGTTLLETILASNSAICAMDEREFLAAAARRFLFADETLDELANLPEPELAIWREAYWMAVEEADPRVAGRIFVNKMPFNSLRLPLIAKLFPDARIILAVRDPRDVVLSCFRHRFDANQLTFEFLRLQDCANFYAATMEFVELCRQKLPLAVHEHKYEDMIADFDASVREVCEFIGVEWTEAMRDFVAASDVIAPRNQSADQVRRGLYSGAIGQWRPYRAEFAPEAPVLAPWIARFDYPAA
jgi:tetratricopeptide (TPR) repeat protein